MIYDNTVQSMTNKKQRDGSWVGISVSVLISRSNVYIIKMTAGFVDFAVIHISLEPPDSRGDLESGGSSLYNLILVIWSGFADWSREGCMIFRKRASSSI